MAAVILEPTEAPPPAGFHSGWAPGWTPIQFIWRFILVFLTPPNCPGDPALHLAPLARNEGAMALVKLPISSLTALVGERELGIACGLGHPPPPFFFLIQFGIRKLWILANGLVPFIPLIPSLVPCSP